MPLKPWVKNLRNKPIQYQKGWTEFYKLKFKLTPDVLIPRPETELLIDGVIQLVNSTLTSDIRHPISVLDVGTGSGCIAISIAKNLPQSRIFALDVSEKALRVAEQNSKLNYTQKQIIFIQSDLLSYYDTLENHSGNPDIIVANLPYIPTSRLMHINPMVTEWEPKIALDGGEDGFRVYEKLFSQMSQKNIIPKYLFCEIDETQGELATQVAKQYFPKAQIEIKKDLAKKNRILMIQF